MSRRLGFLSVGFANLTVMALSAAPSPLYPIYQRVDGFSTFTITLVYAAFALGVLISLFLAGHLSDRHARRRLLVPPLPAPPASLGPPERHRAARHAQLVASSINIGGLGLGPLVAGFLAQWVGH